MRSVLADIFLATYKAKFIKDVPSDGKKQLAIRYIDGVLSIKNPDFENNEGQMYPVELEINGTTESFRFLPRFTSVDRMGGSTLHFHFTTSATISISYLQNSVPGQ